MRLLLGLSAATLLSSLGGAAFAAAPPTSVLDVGTFSSTKVSPNASAATIDAAARLVLAERAPVAKTLSFGPSRAMVLRDGQRIVKLPQTHAGLRVMNRNATVSFGADGVARIVAAKLAQDLPQDVTPSIDATAAAQAASALAGVSMNPQSARLVIWPAADGDHLAWHLYLPSFGLPYAPVVVVDAKTGDVLAHYNAAVRVHQAEVFPSNPVKSPQLTKVTVSLPDGATQLTDPLITAKNCIDTKKVQQITVPGLPFPLGLHVCELLKTVNADPMSLDFNDKPAEDTAPEDPFAELHIYHHTHVAYDYFRSFDPAFKVQEGPLDAVANLRLPAGLQSGDIAKAGDPNTPLEPFQNAFFSPADPGGGLGIGSLFGITGGAMMFGQGPLKDYSYDGDVIYHEFTHAVVNATIQLVGTAHRDKSGLTMSPGAMNEGLADYFSSALTGDPDVGEHAVRDYDPSGSAIRSLTNPDSCPANLGGQVHNDSVLFSAALWDVRANLPEALRSDLDLAVFSAMNAAPSGDLGYEELANLIKAEVKNAAALGDQVATQLDAAFAKRGVLPECVRILDYKGEKMMGPMPVQTQGGGALGVWFSLNVTSANLGQKPPYAPGVFQVRVALPDKAETLQIDFDGANQGGGFGGGGMATPFTPKALVKFSDAPIEFSYSPLSPGADVQVVDMIGGGDSLDPYTGMLPVTPGAKTAYVMIVNAGQTDGLFTNLAFTTTQAAGMGGAGGEGGAGGGGVGGAGGSGGAGGGGTGGGPDLSDEAGCGCSIPGSSNTPMGLSLASLAALIGLLGRRRRK